MAIEQHAYASATADNPANVTSIFIKNPSYDNDKKDNWTWTADGNGEMGMGFSAAEFYMKVFDVHQTMSDLSEGVYSVDVQAFYRAGYGESTAYTAYVNNDPQSKDVKLYAVNGNDTLFTPITTPYPEAGDKVGVGSETEVTTASGKIYIPNDMRAAESYFVDKNRYHNTLFFCSDAGEATIGLKNSKSVDRNWVLFDNWSLKYYGNGADAYQAWWDYFVKDYVELPEGTIYSGNYMAAITDKTVTNKAEVLAGMAAAAVLDENMSLWKQWKEKVDEGFAAYQTYDEVLPEDNEELLNLLIYTDLNDEASDGYAILAAHSLTNDELNAEIVKVEALISAVVEAAKNVVKAGDDMTKYLTNPDFSEGEKGWTGWKTVVQQKWGNGTKNMPVVNESCAEAFSAPNFDLYQEVEGLPLGIYEVSVQGFFRFGRGDDAWNEWNKTGEDRSDYVRTDDPALGSPVFFYVNEKQTPFKNIFEEPGRPGDSPLFDDLATPENEGRTALTKTETEGVVTGVENCLRVGEEGGYLFFPDGMKSAHNYFNANAYKQTTFSAVAHKGDKLRIGVTGRSDVGVAADNPDSWAIFDNFKLVYRGTDKDVVKPVLEDAIVVAEAKQKLSIAKDVKEQLATAISNARTAIDNDADDMFSVLADLWSVDVNGSLQKIQDLKAALTPFENALNKADEAEDDLRPNQSVIDEATSVRNTAQSYVDGKTEFSNADIESITERMKELTDALKVPAAMGVASDDNEANATYLIVNPTYETNSADRTLPEGWKQEGTDAGNYRANSGVYEVWNPHTNILAYQDLEKMPAGTYELSVQGVYRYGWADKEFEAYAADVNTYNYGYLYVKVGDSEPMTYPLPRLATLAEEYEVEYKVNDDGEPVLNDKGEKQYDPRDAWIWAQKNISEDESTASGYIMPDQLKTLTPFFEDETVEPTRLIFKVGEEGKARIGIDIKQVIDGNWVVWDNWKLTYYGPNSSKTQGGIVDGVQDVSAQADVVKTEVFNLSGAQVKNSKGVAIVRQTLNNGTVRVKKVIK